MTFDEWLLSYSWLQDRGRQCIVSADLDGIACALLQSTSLDWQTVGTYDGKVLALYCQPDEVQWNRVVFIDVEILRRSVHSIGNHLFALDTHDVEHLRAEFPNCANPNLWRGINVSDSFQRKYPFSTLPLLLAAKAVRVPDFRLERFWLALVLHTDSSFTNAAMYQANALEWLRAMDTDGRHDGLDRMCRRFNRIPGQIMVALLHEVQQWIAEAGFGGKQRACRFDPRREEDIAKAAALVDRLATEIGNRPELPFASTPVYSEEFETRTLPNHTVGRRRNEFTLARDQRVLSMAATGRTDSGLSITLPNVNSPIEALR